MQTTKERGSGYWRTPDAHSMRGPCSEARMKMKLEKGMPISLNDQVRHPNLMWPTPRASAAMAEKTESIQNRGTQRGKLEEKVAMMPTPTARDWRDAGPNVNYEKAKKKGKIGWSQWWQSEPNVGRVAHGVPKRVDRLKSLGNSLVPMIPYYIGMSIKKGDMLWTKK